MNLLREAMHLAESCNRDRQEMHRHAETGFELARTREYVTRRLREMRLAPAECGGGVICCMGSGEKTILLRADMDALPIRETAQVPFACADGCMHACGHDMHAAMLLCAAQLLNQHADNLKCRVKLMFQPAEELLAGAAAMISDGVLEKPHVDAAVMLHVLVGPEIPVGTVIVAPPGACAPAAGFFSAQIRGSGGHGAMSADSVDPVNAAAHILLSLQSITSRELGWNDSAALTIGKLQAGTAANVIPNSAVLAGSFRSYSRDTMAFIRRRIDEIIRNTAHVFRAEADVRFEGSCPVLTNDEDMCRFARRVLGNATIPALNAAELQGGRAAGSDDFANISQRVPSVMLALAAGRASDGHAQPLHHPAVTFDEAALPYGAAAYAAMALEFE